MPLPIAGVVSIASSVLPNLFKKKTTEAVAVQRVMESLDGAFRARDARRLLIISQKGTVDLPYPNSAGPGWSTQINWSVSPMFRGERDTEAAYAGQLYQRLTGTSSGLPTGGQVPGVSAIASHSDAAGGSALDAINRAVQAAIAAGRTDILQSAGMADPNTSGNVPVAQRAAISPILLIILAIVLFTLFKRK
jgi:hypothetical protein